MFIIKLVPVEKVSFVLLIKVKWKCCFGINCVLNSNTEEEKFLK
jgi:hypothetical protein